MATNDPVLADAMADAARWRTEAENLAAENARLRQQRNEARAEVERLRTAIPDVAERLRGYATMPVHIDMVNRLLALVDGRIATLQPLPAWERELLQRQVPETETAEWWNAHVPVGTPVTLWPGKDAAGRLVGTPTPTRTRTPAWTLGDGTAVVSVEGRTGGMALWALTPRPEDPPRLRDCGAIITSAADVPVICACGKRHEPTPTEGDTRP